MRRFLGAALCVALSGFLSAQGVPEEPAVKGKVLDADGRPVAGATVRAHALDFAQGVLSLRPAGETTSAADGSFSFRAGADRRIQVCARKEGLALGFDGWFHTRAERELEIRLTKPATLSGNAVDEAGAPVAGADVWVSLSLRAENRYVSIVGLPPLDWLRARSDAQGRFSFTDLPADAAATFRAEAPGRARISVYPESSEPRYTVGMTDVRIVLPLSARIEGTVVDKATRRPVAAVALSLQQPGGWLAEPCVSGPDGTFSADRLRPGRCTVALVMSRQETAEWVAENVETTLEAGKPAPRVTVDLSKGGILEVAFIDARTERPIPGAYCGIAREGRSSGGSFAGVSAADGVARIRVLPGRYAGGTVSATGYAYGDLRGRRLDVADGGSARVEMRLMPLLKIRGTVRDEAGNALAGADVYCFPGYGATLQTPADGAFVVIQGQNFIADADAPPFLLARHVERNLAALVEAPQDDKPLDITLVPAFAICGRVVDPQGRPIPGAKVSATMRFDRHSAAVAKQLAVDAGGGYEVKALPPGGDYVIFAGAAGYGNGDVTVWVAAAGDRRCKAEDIVLPPANLSVSGVVVGEDGKPLAGARVNAYGAGQPPRTEVTTDADGKFTVTGLCAGTLQVGAGLTNPQRSGNVEARAGDQDVKIVIRERQAQAERPPAPVPPSLVGKPLPDLAALKITLDADTLKGKMILLCFHDADQRPSRRCMQALEARRDELAKKDVVLVPVPAAAVTGDTREPTFAWGARGLPWLVLAGREHVVRAEGFAVDALDENLKQLAAGKP